jgi:hypothetical protein
VLRLQTYTARRRPNGHVHSDSVGLFEAVGRAQDFSDIAHLSVLSNISIEASKQLPAVTKVAAPDSSPVADPPTDEAQELYEQSISGQPDRKELCVLMGVDYKNHKEKIRIRKHLRGYFVKWLPIDKPFSHYNYHREVYPVVKSATTFMNKHILTGKKWTKEITQFVIHSIFEDDRRNKTQAAKRRTLKQKSVLVGLPSCFTHRSIADMLVGSSEDQSSASREDQSSAAPGRSTG